MVVLKFSLLLSFPILHWKSSKCYMFITYSGNVFCSLRYPARNARSYFHLWPVLAVKDFSTLSYKWHDFRKKLLSIKYVFWFSLQRWPETFIILKITERGVTKNLYWSSRKVPIILVRCNETWFFSGCFRKIFKYQISSISVHWETRCSMRKDGRTDGETDTNLIVAFLSFVKTPTNGTAASNRLAANAADPWTRYSQIARPHAEASYHNVFFWGAGFTKLRKENLSFVMSVHLSVRT